MKIRAIAKMYRAIRSGLKAYNEAKEDGEITLSEILEIVDEAAEELGIDIIKDVPVEPFAYKASEK